MITPPKRSVKRGTNGPIRLDSLAKACLGPAIARYGFGSAEILARWPEIVGPELGRCTRPERVRWPRRRDGSGNGEAATLIIRAEGGDALEVQHLTGPILERINAFFGWRAVERISIRQAPVQAPVTRKAEPAAPSSAGPANVDIVQDEALRRALDRLGRRIAAKADKMP